MDERVRSKSPQEQMPARLETIKFRAADRLERIGIMKKKDLFQEFRNFRSLRNNVAPGKGD